MKNWDYLNETQLRDARLAAKTYHTQHPSTLPTYSWLLRNVPGTKDFAHNTLIAFGRVVINECKVLMKRAS